MTTLLKHLNDAGVDTEAMMDSIDDIITKTLLSVEPVVSHACEMFTPTRYCGRFSEYLNAMNPAS